MSKLRPEPRVDSLMANLRFCEKECVTCRYYRESYSKSSTTSECLLIGRTLAIASPGEDVTIHRLSVGRVCDGWKRRPLTWMTSCKDINPHWEDKYLSRESLVRIRRRFAISQGRKSVK